MCHAARVMNEHHPGILGSPTGWSDVTPSSDDLANLRLDQVIDAISAWAPDTDVDQLLTRPLRDLDTVRYRQAVVTDLQRAPVLQRVRSFCRTMSRVRRSRDALRPHANGAGGSGWHVRTQLVELDRDYVEACVGFHEALHVAPLRSEGMLGVRDLIAAHIDSARFRDLADQSSRVLAGIAGVSFGLHLTTEQVRVGGPTGDGDFVERLTGLLARLAPHAPAPGGPRPVSPTGPSPLEYQLLDVVAAQRPETFDALAEHCRRHLDVSDPGIERFCQEVSFYLAYLDHIAPLRDAGLPFCLPDVQADASAMHVVDGFDLALACTRRAHGATTVLNDAHLTGDERVLVVTGPNQGGKTTFARMVGQIHYLAALGLPVPARSATVPLVDSVLTHVAAAETPDDPVGRLEQDLLRVREVLHRASGRSVVVMNEVFSSTSQQDAYVLGRRVLETLAARGAIVVFVTFVDALATLGAETVSMVSEAPSDDPGARTFRIERRPPVGSAHAVALARAHRLTYGDVMRRIQR